MVFRNYTYVEAAALLILTMNNKIGPRRVQSHSTYPLNLTLLFFFFALPTLQSFQHSQHRHRFNGLFRPSLFARWDTIDESLPIDSSNRIIDSVIYPEKPSLANNRPTLFRERHGWCPYSERVWLALEYSDTTQYDTILIDNTGGPRPSYYAGQTPKVQWPDGKQQGESMDLVIEIDQRYNLNLNSNVEQVQYCIQQFSNIFPKRSRPSSRAAFLFQLNGEPLWKTTFEATLAGVEKLLEESNGPYFAGKHFTIADICYIPFLERFRYQLPCLHQKLQPFDEMTYPCLYRWYQAVDQIPAYMGRVRGDASSWRKVLSMAGFGNMGIPPDIQQNMDALKAFEREEATIILQQHQDVWHRYAASRPHVSSTPLLEAARIISRNRKAIVKDTAQSARQDPWKNTGLPATEEDINEALYTLTLTMITSDSIDHMVINDPVAVSLAKFLDERMCVPRDMGVLPAACVKLLANKVI